MTIVITSKRDGFRRCGIAHPGKPTFYPDDFFTEEQLAALDKEPQLILAYAGEEFDQVKDVLDDTLSQTPSPEAPDTIQGAQPQAPETVTTPLAAPLVSDADTILTGDESGTTGPGTSDIDSGGNDDSLIDNQDDAAGDYGSDDQSTADQQDAAKAPVTPPKAKLGKAKAGKE